MNFHKPEKIQNINFTKLKFHESNFHFVLIPGDDLNTKNAPT